MKIEEILNRDTNVPVAAPETKCNNFYSHKETTVQKTGGYETEPPAFSVHISCTGNVDQGLAIEFAVLKAKNMHLINECNLLRARLANCRKHYEYCPYRSFY